MPSGGGGGSVIIPVPIASGGTGQVTAAAALAALGGVATSSLPLAIASGGTGQITAAAALAALGGVGSHTLKRGTHAGNYTTTSASYVAIDSANLDISATVPVGMLAISLFVGNGIAGAGACSVGVAVDGTVGSNTFIGAPSVPSGSSVPIPAPPVVLVGDGSSHTFSPRFQSNGSATIGIINDNALDAPTHLLLLIPAT